MESYIDQFRFTIFPARKNGKRCIHFAESLKARMLLSSINPESVLKKQLATALRRNELSELTWKIVTTTPIEE